MLTSGRYTNPVTEKKKSIFHIYLYFFYRLNITRSGRQKYDLIGNFNYFKKMRLHPADMQTRRQKKNFDFSIFFFIFYNRLNITRSGRQKYELIGNFKSFKKMHLHPTDMKTRQKKKFRFFHIFLYFF